MSGQIIANDPSAVIDVQRITRQLNNMIAITDASIVRVKCLVGPQAKCASPNSGEGGSGRNGHSRFRCKHFLSGAPNIVYIMREDTAESDHPQSVINPRPEENKNTVTHAMVLINTDFPIGDEDYSYFTIGFPMSGWHEHSLAVTESSPDIQRSFATDVITNNADNRWGDIRGATIEKNGAEFLPFSTAWRIADEPASRRVFDMDTSITDPNQIVNLSIFFQQYAGTFVTVRVFSAIIDGLSFDALATPHQASPAPARRRP